MKKRTIYLIFTLVFLLAVAKVFASARLATTGTALAEIETQSQSLSGQNLFLEEEILGFSSLVRISSEAAKLGLVQATKVVGLTPEIPIALRGSY